jgi:prephenate dehydrogenase
MIGCGLIGTSMALAIRGKNSDARVDGVEVSHRHLTLATDSGAYQQVYSSFPDNSYDLAVLAVPIQAACALLPEAASKATFVMDVCSVKTPICQLASELALSERFVPSHPMAGNSGQGPASADKSLFRDRPWILVEDWPACHALAPWIESFDSRIEWVESAEQHDAAMAAVSHGIHLMSVTAMLAAAFEADNSDATNWELLTGPGFRDVTRLSQSPHDFWVPTLMANKQSVGRYLKAARDTMMEIERCLEAEDNEALARVLKAAKSAKDAWTTAKTQSGRDV